jgi:hypothetical protein
MQFLELHKRIAIFGATALFFLFVSSSCGLKKDESGGVLARVGESYLYAEDAASLLTNETSKQDSATIVSNFINNWAAKQLLLEKAKINLSDEKLAEFDALVDDYRADLYTRAYKEALVWQGSDSTVSRVQLRAFYEREKENFKLKEKIVKIRFVELPKPFLNKKEVIRSLKNFKKPDRKYLDSIGVQFKKLNFNDSIWIRASRVIDEIPPMTHDNEAKYLKKSQFFELEDANGVYLGKIIEMRRANDVSPLSFIEPTLRQVLLNRRKLEYARKLDTEIIDEAIKDKEFEVYVQNE